MAGFFNDQVWDWKTEDKPEMGNTVTTGEVAINPPFVQGLTSIIVAVYNLNYPLLHFTGHCLGSIKERTDKTKTPYEIILIDNASPVGFGKPEDYRVDKYVKNEKNLGVAKAWNKGIRISSGEYICLLNNDTLVFNHWLEDLQRCLEKIDFVTATPMYGEPFARAVESEQKRQEWINKPVEESFTDFRDFSCAFTRKEVFADLGLFDEQFFAYGEDLDFRNRMDKAGLVHKATKLVNIFHVINATASNMPEIPKIMDESREKLEKKQKEGIGEVPPVQKEPVQVNTEDSKVWGSDMPSATPEPKTYTIDSPPAVFRTAQTGDKVFFAKNKTAYWVTSPEVLSILGLGFGDVVTIGQDLFYQFDLGENLNLENVASVK